MPAYLSQEWLDLNRTHAQDFPERPGATARIQYVVTDAPDGGRVLYHWVVEDGRLLVADLGEDPDAEITLTSSYEDSVRIAKGELDANAAFMQGRMKVDGNMGKLMSLLPVTQSPEYRAIQERTAAETQF
jgi:putative sterol carrier protein